jgi:ureidoacrylate peracid hydrolase
MSEVHDRSHDMMHDHSRREGDSVTVEARPQPLTLPLAKTAVLVIDMQNDFGADGGLFQRAGIDLSGIREVIAPIGRVLERARAQGVPVIYLQWGLRPDLLDLHEIGSPLRARYLDYGVGQPCRTPDGGESTIGIRDTWNSAIIDELEPTPGDVCVYKHGYSAFHQTELDAVLKALGVKYLIVTGCTTSVCVETAIREAHARDYRCILLEDCTAEPIGRGAGGYVGVPGANGSSGGANYDATLVLVQTIFGWVSNSECVLKAFETKRVLATES